MCGHYMGVPDGNSVGYYLKCSECGRTWEFVWDEATEEFEENWIEPDEDILDRPEKCLGCNGPWPECEARCESQWDSDLYE